MQFLYEFSGKWKIFHKKISVEKTELLNFFNDSIVVIMAPGVENKASGGIDDNLIDDKKPGYDQTNICNPVILELVEGIRNHINLLVSRNRE